MNISASIRALLLAMAAISLLTGCRGFTFEAPPIHPNPNMDQVTRFDPQEPAEFWSDGRSLRPQVDGTVPRGGLRIDGHRYDGRVNGGYATELPVDVELSSATLERGQERYGIYCTPCHGEAGSGAGIVPTRWEGWVVPTFHDERRRGLTVGYIYEVITNGVNTMPAYAAQIPVDDRWAIAAYVRALQVSQGANLEMLPREVASEQGWTR